MQVRERKEKKVIMQSSEKNQGQAVGLEGETSAFSCSPVGLWESLLSKVLSLSETHKGLVCSTLQSTELGDTG